MKKLFLLLAAFLIVENVSAQRALHSLFQRDSKKLSQMVSPDTIVSTFNMGVYDVDEDCYKDVAYSCYKIINRERLIYFSVQLIEQDPVKKHSLLFIDNSEGNRPLKQLESLILTMEYLRDKYADWSNTAKENKITDYRKEFGDCDLKKQTFYLSYFNKEKNASYISQTKFFFTPIFHVTDVGTCLLKLEQEDRKHLVGELAKAASYMSAQQRGDRQTMKEYLRKNKSSDYFKILGNLQFSSREQVQSFIDALRYGLTETIK
jgi:hypothetical protein